MGAEQNFRPPADRVVDVFDRCTQLLPVIRAAGNKCGYAIGSHGSFARDLDLIACPWTDAATDAETLVEAVRAAIETVPGWAPVYYRSPSEWGQKPHGRVAVSIYSGGDAVVVTTSGAFPWIDLSIMPLDASSKQPNPRS